MLKSVASAVKNFFVRLGMSPDDAFLSKSTDYADYCRRRRIIEEKRLREIQWIMGMNPFYPRDFLDRQR